MSNKIKKNKIKKNFLKIILILFFINLLITAYLFFGYKYKKTNPLKLAKNDNKAKTTIKPNITNITPFNQLQFNQLQSSPLSKKMFFTFKIENINFQNKILYIDLMGENNLSSDAIDLELEIDDNIEVKKIIEGNSFNSYPRKIISQNNIIITGTALNENGELKLAKPKSNFIKIYFSLKNTNKKSSIKLNQKKTKIFFHGENITDIQNSFKEINFN
jgi:flagellar basal body-associated protein FliL